jgi:hypothetical protein
VCILSQRIPPLRDPDASHRLTCVQHVAETPARRGFIHTVVFGAHRDVRRELLQHFIVGRPPPEPTPFRAHHFTFST